MSLENHHTLVHLILLVYMDIFCMLKIQLGKLPLFKIINNFEWIILLL